MLASHWCPNKEAPPQPVPFRRALCLLAQSPLAAFPTAHCVPFPVSLPALLTDPSAPASCACLGTALPRPARPAASMRSSQHALASRFQPAALSFPALPQPAVGALSAPSPAVLRSWPSAQLLRWGPRWQGPPPQLRPPHWGWMQQPPGPAPTHMKG